MIVLIDTTGLLHREGINIFFSNNIVLSHSIKVNRKIGFQALQMNIDF